VPLNAFAAYGAHKNLLSALLEALDDEDLKTISRLDYGMDFDDHLAKLRRIKASGFNGFALDGYLVEVLDLCAWSEPSSETDIFRVHRQRAFSCVVLYGSGHSPSDRFYTDETKLIQLVESLIVLGWPRPDIICFFSLLLSDIDEGDREAVFIGLVLLVFALQDKSYGNDEVLTLIDWIMTAGDAADMNELEQRSPRGWDFASDGRGRFNAKWRLLMASLPGHVQPRHGPSIVEGVALLVAMALPAVTEHV
jgi:hypothetical protein